MQLNQKECTLIKDMKDQEILCRDKYNRAAACANDPQLKGLFQRLAQNEQEHFDTLTQIESGTVPQPAGQSAPPPAFNAVYTGETSQKKDDCYLCSDALSAEKHASHLYDTCVFEFRDENVRKMLNHIQAEEQEHGKMIYDYMAANAMYA